MKTLKIIITSTIVILLLMQVSCDRIPDNPNNENFTDGIFPIVPVNLSDFNTIYDDYNSNIAILGDAFPFLFSSNRNSKGSNYDIIFKLMFVEFSKINGKLKIYNNTSTNLDVYLSNENIKTALSKINTTFDEFGPYLIPQGRIIDATEMAGAYESYIFLYSTNQNGNQDIMFTHNLFKKDYESPAEVGYLNTQFDDAYPTFNETFSGLYFTSDREGIFNIYKAKTDSTKPVLNILADKMMVEVEKDTILSSTADDKCPFISGNMMVFTSNRAGGFGGYDLYYSIFENGEWGQPVNFGEKINSEFDEYRPIIRPFRSFTNDFMIFSSNRPGGKGGFDLYYVGIQKITFENSMQLQSQ